MEENLVFVLEDHCRKDIQHTGRHLAIDNSWDRDRNVFESINLSLLRSLTVFGKWESFIISDKMKLLRVLDLEDVSSGVTNRDVEQMNSSAVAVAPVSSTCAPLGSCLSKSRIHLPYGSHSGVKVPRGIGKLSSLHTLGVVSIHSAGEDGILEELKKITQQHKLGVSGINRKNSEKFFSYISRLESLSLQMPGDQDNEAARWIPDISSPLEKLRSLKLHGLVDRLPSWITEMCLQLPRLEKLDLQMKMLHQQQLDFIITLPVLRSLRLRLAEFEQGELRFGWNITRRGEELEASGNRFSLYFSMLMLSVGDDMVQGRGADYEAVIAGGTG
ncbi:hypothetical protein HU200_048896 [Digitaria exilis]|uniref:Disease resistance R13L4/SHOC-2-like LRR domain-containing protein n=1 Tax=Digitaria exilis TaxID=1010633 RepID=A0A835B058_9POAL|nr:hypothetical protein HU200_048896 [Digitaria exilis]